MRKLHLAAVIVIVAVLAASVGSIVVLNSQQTPKSNSPVLYTYHVIKTYSHDTGAFTEGLVYDNGTLYESTGGYGDTFGVSSSDVSSLRRVDLENGNVTKEILLASDYFGEGLTVVNGSLIQLTWQNGIGFIYNKETFALEGNFSYNTEGWGLTYDGKELVMSDGTSNLYFLDPVTFQKTGQVTIHNGNASVTNINELEYINGDVYANIWLTQKIAIINPQTGTVKGIIDLTGLYQPNGESVLNGIAYDSQTNRLFVTGKNWPNLYQITITPKT